MAVSVLGIGLLLALDTLVSQAFGGGRSTSDCRRSWLVTGLWIAALLSPLPFTLALAGLALAALNADGTSTPEVVGTTLRRTLSDRLRGRCCR